MKPTQEEINKEIERLNDAKEKVIEFTFFRDSNKLAIQAQIDVLSGKMTEEADIYNEYDEEDRIHEMDNALVALEWKKQGTIDGEECSLYSSWESAFK